jgi:hypothetical protein
MPALPELRELQRAFGNALLTASGPQALSELAAMLGVEQPLLAIYRNTAVGTLSHALSLSFPAVQQIVGEDFFEGAAQQFIATHPPTGACLDAYGHDLPSFLAQFPPAASLSYLADVARLEWAVNRALHAPDAAPLALGVLAALDAARMPLVSFVPHPAVTVMRVETPADAIWRAVLAEDEAAMAALDLTAGAVWLLIERAAAGVQVQRLSAVSGAFTARLFAGESLQRALDAAAVAAPVAAVATAGAPEALETTLAEHLAAGRFTAWTEQGDRTS